jgi:hypothetical protein
MQTMKNLQSRRIGKVGRIGVSWKSLIAVCEIPMRHVGREIPESSVWIEL